MKYRIGDTICLKTNGKIYSNLFVSGSVRSARVYFLRKNYCSWRKKGEGGFVLEALCHAMHNEKTLFNSKQVLIEKFIEEYNMKL